MSRAEMRAKARECEIAATKKRDPAVTMMYAALVLQWQQLADEIEKQKKQK